MKILVPISEAHESAEAIPEAVARAGKDGHLVLASIGEDPEVSKHARDVQAALRKRLDEVARDIVGLPVTKRIELAGDPVRGIVEIARDEHVDQIVIASSHRSAFERLVDGSVADDLRDALQNIPVEIVSAR